MTEFNLRRYIAKETAIGIFINVLVATTPSLIFIHVSTATAFSPVREVAVGLTPQFFMAALGAVSPMRTRLHRMGFGL